MVFPLMCVLIFPIVIVFLIRAIYLIIFINGKSRKKVVRIKPSKTLIVLGSGGHTTEILRIVQHLDKKKYFPRIYIQAQTDEISSNKVKQLEKNTKDYKIIEIARSREVHQSYFTSILSTFYAIIQSFPLVWKEKPDLLLCNGPGTCIPPCLVTFFFNSLFILNTKIVFIESFCRVKSFSLSGKILYYLANHSIVQWPYLNGNNYPRNKMLEKIIIKHIDWKIFEEDLEAYAPNELKYHLRHLLVKLQNWYKNDNEASESKKVKTCYEHIDNDLLAIEACVDRTWEMLNSGYWKDVPVNYRYCYAICSVIKAILLEIEVSEECDDTKVDNKYKEIFEVIDKGMLLGAPLPRNENLLSEIASNLNQYYLLRNKSDKKSETLKIDDKTIDLTPLPGFITVSNFNKPSMEKFYCDIFKPKVPALLEGCTDHWKALHLWQDIEYLRKIAGNRTVPIEIGSRYTDDNWSQSLLMFSDFLNTHISTKNEKVGYLAQHQLFDQIPELKNDFSVPDYCSFSDKEGDETLPDINAWFGPEGTVSPLHYDPKNNLLCQVFGYKRIILYSPEDNENLYSYETRFLNNTAQVDPYNPDFENYPNFQKAKGYMCYLKPGDMLFIPPKWWHHVVGLTPSFSISFWWD